MKSHKGGSLRARGARSVDAKQMAALMQSPAASAAQERADGPRKGEHHPPKLEGRVDRTVPAKSSEFLYETRVAVTQGPVPDTPAPTKSWQATLQGKGGFPADAQIAVSTTHVIVTNRQRMRYYDKNGNALGNDIGSTSFFTAGLNLKDAAGNPIDRFNDLRIIFDSYRKRFWVTAYAGFSGAANVPVA